MNMVSRPNLSIQTEIAFASTLVKIVFAVLMVHIGALVSLVDVNHKRNDDQRLDWKTRLDSQAIGCPCRRSIRGQVLSCKELKIIF